MKIATTIIGFFLLFMIFSPNLVAEVTVIITSPEEGAVVAPCGDVFLEAAVTATAGEEVKDLTFYYNGLAKRRVRSAPWEYTWPNIPKGVYELTAKLTTQTGEEFWSEPVRFKAGAVSAGEKLFNGGFDCGTIAPWRGTIDNQASAAFVVYDDIYFEDQYYLEVEIESVGAERWSIQLFHKCPIDSGHTYEISFLADAPELKQIYLGMQEAQDPWLAQFSANIDIDGANLYGPYEFIAERTDPTNDLVFHFGGDDTPVILDDVRVIDRSASSVKSKNIEFGRGIISEYELFQAYPNPFNMNTKIQFNLSNPAEVVLEIYNMAGQKVNILDSGFRAEGLHTISWNGSDRLNQTVPSGVYIYKLSIANGAHRQELSRKVLLLK